MRKHLCLLLALLLCLTLLSAPALAAEGPVIEEEPAAEAPVIEEEEPAFDGAGDLPITLANFPDEVFRGYVWEHIDQNGDGKLTEQERLAVRQIDVSGWNIGSLQGIENFFYLQYLDCSGCHIRSLKLTDLIEQVDCSGNGMTSLTISSSPRLRKLDCSDNDLTSLSTKGCSSALLELYCEDNRLTSLDIRNTPSLRFVSCYNNRLTSLDLSGSSELRVLDCSGNSIRSIDIQNCPQLVDAYRNGSRTPLLNDGTNFYYFLDSAGPYTINGSGQSWKFRSMLITDAGVTVSDGTSPTLNTVTVKLSQDCRTAAVSGDYRGLYVRVAIVIKNRIGDSGLYVTQATIGSGGQIQLPSFYLAGVTIQGVNVALVPTLADIQSSSPRVLATDFKRF